MPMSVELILRFKVKTDSSVGEIGIRYGLTPINDSDFTLFRSPYRTLREKAHSFPNAVIKPHVQEGCPGTQRTNKFTTVDIPKILYLGIEYGQWDKKSCGNRAKALGDGK